MTQTISEQNITPVLNELARKTGLLAKPLDSVAVDNLFVELEKYDEGERSKTFQSLKRALNETRTSLGAEPAFKDE